MTATPEQQAVIDADVPQGTVYKCAAYAGTGKTSTLVHVSFRYPNDKVIYLAFNKSVEQEAVERFPTNTTAKTTHALAFATVGMKYRNVIGNLYHWQLGKAYHIPNYEAALLLHSINNFLKSADPEPADCHVADDTLDRFDPDKYVNGMVEKMQLVWDDMVDSRNNIPMTHDGYFKLLELGDYHLPYNVVLLDEAQDTNPVCIKFALNQLKRGARLYLVGDQYQQIYSWRGAIDAMSKVPGPESRLTQSFRFGTAIGDVGSVILRTFFNEHVPLRGTDSILSKVGEVDTTKPYTIVCRTNAGVIQAAYSVALQGGLVAVNGEPQFHELLNHVDQIFYLYSGKKNQVTDNRLRWHPDYRSLVGYAQETLDGELQVRISLMEKFKMGWPDVKEAILKALTTVKSPSRPPNVILTTCHKAKGLEWDQVQLGPDFKPLYFTNPEEDEDERIVYVERLKKVVDRPTHEEHEIHREELNLLYVAATRAKYVLEPTRDLSLLLRRTETEKQKQTSNNETTNPINPTTPTPVS